MIRRLATGFAIDLLNITTLSPVWDFLEIAIETSKTDRLSVPN